jgi:hypothetical protein
VKLENAYRRTPRQRLWENKHGARLQDFWDGLVSESRRKEPGIPLEKVKADLVKRGRLRES